MKRFYLLGFVCILSVFISGCLEGGGGGGGGGPSGSFGFLSDSGGDSSNIVYIAALDSNSEEPMFLSSDEPVDVEDLESDTLALSLSIDSEEPLGSESPEPSSLALLGSGLLAILGYRKLHRQSAKTR